MSDCEPTNWTKRASLAVLTVYWLLLFAGTHVPRLKAIPVQHSDKVLHAVAYAGLAFLLALAWSQRTAFGPRQVVAVLAILAIYGGLDEITQPLVGRVADWLDWGADVSGTLAGLALFSAVRTAWRRTMKPAVG